MDSLVDRCLQVFNLIFNIIDVFREIFLSITFGNVLKKFIREKCLLSNTMIYYSNQNDNDLGKKFPSNI